jgi:predicted MPP superfamily phosphohydrolase
VAHVVPALAASGVLGWPGGVLSAAFAWLVVSVRFRRLALDKRRARWLTAGVDLPLFTHWGASLLSTSFFAVAAPLSVLLFGTSALLSTAQGAYAAGFLLSAWAVWVRRRWVRVVEIDVALPDLDAAFSGYRIVHLSDLHIGSYDSKERGFVWTALANSLDPDLVAVTGDLVTSGVEFYPDVADVLSTLRARDGVVVSLGNHDQWDGPAFARVLEGAGTVILRNTSRIIRRGASEIVVAGLDDRFTGRDDLDAALVGRSDGAPTVLLSHYPDFFEAAAARGVELVLSGHTHGGQIGVPFAADAWNLARLTGQKSRGLYRSGASQLFVNAGLGTTGPPMRLGVAPEIAVLVLRPA